MIHRAAANQERKKKTLKVYVYQFFWTQQCDAIDSIPSKQVYLSILQTVNNPSRA